MTLFDRRMIALCVALGLLWLVFPGDVPFLGDEAGLIAGALTANESGELAARGLSGTHGFAYGPVPIWLYQLGLLLSHDLVVIVVLRAALSAVTIAAAAFWLARTLGLWTGFVPVLLCSPYLWYYARVPWDNSFAVPLSALAFAAYVSFLRHGGIGALAVAVAAGFTLPLIHLMAVAFVVPLAIHALAFRPRQVLRASLAIVPIVGAGALAAAPYLSYLWQARAGAESQAGSVGAIWFAAIGAHLLGGWDVERIFGPMWMRAGVPWISMLQSISLVAVVLSAAGGVCALVSIAAALRGDGDRLKAHAAALVLAIVVAQAFVGVWTGKIGHSHYFNATWFAYALLAWLSVDRMRRHPGAAEGVAILQGGASLAVLLFLLIRVHTVFPSREHYGATLANQIAVAAELERRPKATTLEVRTESARLFPIALDVLRRLEPGGDESTLPATPLRLVYASEDPLDGRIRLEEGSEPADSIGTGGE